jgi:hypothetical protein
LDFIYIPADAATSITLVGVDILNWTYVVNGTVTVAGPDISVSPTEKDFGNITVGSSLPQTFNVSNVGYADLVVGAINITGTNADQFTIQNDNVSNQTIIAGGSATLQVVFTPTSTGAKSATLNIPSNDPDEATVLVPLTGTGVTGEPDISVSPTEKNFGNINVGSSSSPQTFNVSNVGDADLVVWTINITGTHANQFTIHNDNVTNQTIIANGSAALQVVFSPTSTGAKSATLNIPSNDPYEATVSVSLSGTGITGGGGGGGGGGLAAYYLTVNMLGDISKWNISEQGNLLEPLQVSSADNKVTIALGKAASCLDKGNNRLSSITISRQSGWPSLPEDYSIIGTAYAFRPAGAKFAPSLSLTLGYADNDVPQYVSEEDIYIAYYDATAESWVPLTSQVNTQNNRISAPVRHFTTFAIMGEVIPPTPAKFSVTSLDLSSEQVEPGQEVLVTVNVTNTGGSEGSYTLDLTINGEVEQTKTVTLAASASDTVTFVVIKEELGTYTVSVDGLTKEFIVGAPSWVSQYWWIVLAAIVIIGVVVSFLWARRRRVRA